MQIEIYNSNEFSEGENIGGATGSFKAYHFKHDDKDKKITFRTANFKNKESLGTDEDVVGVYWQDNDEVIVKVSNKDAKRFSKEKLATKQIYSPQQLIQTPEINEYVVSDWYGQVKPSVKSKGFFNFRRRKAGGLDTENYSEIIAANIASYVEDKTLVPDVCFVVDEKKKTVGIVSRYLENVKGELLKNKNKQLVIKKYPETENEINSKQAKGICEAIALSILVGDHDINPQNMLKISDDKIARIDYGHAFNDLLSKSKFFGGRVRNKENQVLDFFNRERVNTMKIGDSTKLWRSYENLIPSKEMADALEKMSENASEERIKAGIADSKDAFKYLLSHRNVDKNHVLESLAAVANNLEGEKIEVDFKNPQETIDKVFERIETFSIKQTKDMKLAAELMKAQVELDKRIKKGTTFNKEELHKLKEKFGSNGKINWFKTSKKEKALSCDVEDYIRKSAKRLGVDKDLVPNKPSLVDVFREFISKINAKIVTPKNQIYQSIPTTENPDVQNHSNPEADNRPLSKLASVREFEGDSERRTAVYTEVHEDSSTESTYKSPAEVEFRKSSNIRKRLASNTIEDQGYPPSKKRKLSKATKR